MRIPLVFLRVSGLFGLFFLVSIALAFDGWYIYGSMTAWQYFQVAWKVYLGIGFLYFIGLNVSTYKFSLLRINRSIFVSFQVFWEELPENLRWSILWPIRLLCVGCWQLAVG